MNGELDGISIPDGYSLYVIQGGDTQLLIFAKIIIDEWGKFNSYIGFLYPKAQHDKVIAAIKRNHRKVHKMFNKWAKDNVKMVFLLEPTY